MCSRYYVELSPELQPIIEAARHSPLADKMVHKLGRPVIREGEVRPTDIAPVIAPNSKGNQAVFPMIWGFILPDKENTKRAQSLINARSETADTKHTFRECWQRRRCVVPASWYFEWSRARTASARSPLPLRSALSDAHWASAPPRTAHEMEHFTKPDGSKKAGDKYAIQPAGATVTWLAGLYRLENGFPHFAILTRESSGELSRIHDRMPLILPGNVIGEWINPNTDADTIKEIASSSLTEMIFEKP